MNWLPVILSISVIATFVLIIAGIHVIRGGNRTKGMLMIAVAVVLLANVMIMSWTPVSPVH
jgi:hypothetical protein